MGRNEKMWVGEFQFLQLNGLTQLLHIIYDIYRNIQFHRMAGLLVYF